MAKPNKKYDIFVDNEKYPWEESSINGAQIRVLAGVPEGAQIFLEVPGKPDLEIKNDTTVDLEAHHGHARFSTQSTGSQAG